MNNLERRLSGWVPASAGLDADAMLFAAGRASAAPGASRFVWPALTGLLGLLVAFLSAWLVVERSERLALAQQLARQVPVSPPSSPAVPAEPASDDAAMPDSYLRSRQALQHGLDAWPPESEGGTGSAESPVSTPVLQVGHRDSLLNP
jgi:hypothetical protein